MIQACGPAKSEGLPLWSRSEGVRWQHLLRGTRLKKNLNAQAAAAAQQQQFVRKAHVHAFQTGTGKNKRSYLHVKGGVSLIERGKGFHLLLFQSKKLEVI